MTESNVLVSTRSTLPAPQNAQIDNEFRLARAIADAGDMIPRGYRGKPGAVILVQQWARQRGLDVMTAMQTVSFVDGKPVIDATMQRALAERDGYEIRIVSADDTVAVVDVWKGDRRIGSASYTIDQAKRANLTGKKNWQQNPEDMLVARATTRAMRRCAPSVLLGTFDPDEAEQVDTLAVLETPAETVESVDVPTPDTTPDIVDAEVVESLTSDTLKARLRLQGITQATCIQEAQKIAGHLDVAAPGSLAGIAENAELLAKVVEWLDSERDGVSA